MNPSVIAKSCFATAANRKSNGAGLSLMAASTREVENAKLRFDARAIKRRNWNCLAIKARTSATNVIGREYGVNKYRRAERPPRAVSKMRNGPRFKYQAQELLGQVLRYQAAASADGKSRKHCDCSERLDVQRSLHESR